MDDLSCAVCSDVYEVRTRDPVSLPKCGHTFCRPCLTSLQHQSLLFKCPSCRTQHTGAIIANLPPVYALLSILEKEKLDRGTLNMCKTHEDPIRLWCRPCYEELCGQCLFERHMTEGHDVVKTETAVDELKQKIEDQFEQLTLSIKEEKCQLVRELHDIAHQLGKLCRKSQKLENYSKRTEATLQTARASYQLKALVKNQRLLDEMMRDVSTTSASQEAFPQDEARSPTPPTTATENHHLQDDSHPMEDSLPKDEITAIEKIYSENEPIEVYDNDLDSNRDNDPQVVSETSKPTENSTSDIALWPLTCHAPGGKADWPKINWYRFLMQVPAVQLLVPPENPQVYLKLSANGKDLGCLQIRLWGHLRRAQNFLALCLGTLGPSYKGSKFSHVAKRGEPGERLIGGLYETEGHWYLTLCHKITSIMWRRPVLVLLYLTVVVVVTWMVELGFWWDTSYTSYQIVNPLRNLTVTQIRTLLEMRGIQYAALLEKSEIIELLQKSGPVQYGELLGRMHTAESHGPLEISGKEDFNEQIYEEKESIWLVEIIPGEGQYAGHRVLDDRAWHSLSPKLQTLQINGAIVSCQYDRRFCARQGWSHPQLLLILPSNEHFEKSSRSRNLGRIAVRKNIALPSAVHLPVSAVLTWLYEQILLRVKVVDNVKALEETWINVTNVAEKKIPHVVYISELLSPPLLIATLGLRLSSRIKLAAFSVKKEEKEQVSRLLKKSGLSGVPTVAVVTSEGITSYGGKKGESMTRQALDSYICMLQPRMNDVFLISLVGANLFAVADFFYIFDYRLRAWKHVVRTFLRVLVYNVTVFLVWLAVTALLKFSYVDAALQSGSWLMSFFNSTWLFGQLRYHWLMVENHPVIFWMSAKIFGIMVIIWRVCFRRSGDQEEVDSNWWALFPMDSYLVNVLFRPMASLSRPRPSQDLGLEEGMELLIERLATPDLWLHPVIPTDYMKHLPMWRFDGWGNEDDLKSESETDVDSVSENENDTLLDSHTCCQDENCRLCELWTTVKEIYVCHRCAILKRKLERQYLRYRRIGDRIHQNLAYERLLKVCESCSKTRKQQNMNENSKQLTKSVSNSRWLLSPQRLTELKWTAPPHAIESRICAICLSRYRWSAVLCGLPCGHHYHHSCITEWLLKDNHHCPTCRWPSYKSKPSNNLSHDHEE